MGIQAMLFHPTEITNMIYLNFFFKRREFWLYRQWPRTHTIYFGVFFFYSGGHLWWCFWRVAFELVLCVCVWCCICGEGGGGVECNS